MKRWPTHPRNRLHHKHLKQRKRNKIHLPPKTLNPNGCPQRDRLPQSFNPFLANAVSVDHPRIDHQTGTLHAPMTNAVLKPVPPLNENAVVLLAEASEVDRVGPCPYPQRSVWTRKGP
jgi:hypothetical protein